MTTATVGTTRVSPTPGHTMLLTGIETASRIATAATPSPTSTTSGGFTLPSNPFDATLDWSAVWESLLNQIGQFFGRLLWALAILLIGWLVIAFVVQPILRRIINNRQLDPILGQFIVILISSVLKFFLISTSIGVLGVEQLSIAAFVAFFGVGVGQGVSGIMKDFIAGLILVVQKPIRHGDWVEANSAEGEVVHVGLTHTTIRSAQRCHNIVPNSNITSGRIVNYNKEEIMRVHVEFYVRHNEDLRLCREVFLEIAACDPRILPHPAPHFRVAEIGKDGVKISCRPYVLKDDFWGVTFDLKAQLKWAYQRYGIQFQISRLEVEMTPIVEPSSIPPTAAPSRAGSFDGEFDDDDTAMQACLAKVTLDEKMSRRNALPTLRAEADAVLEDAGAGPMNRSMPVPILSDTDQRALEDGEETDNIGDIDHYAPPSRADGYRVANVTRRDILRLHALASRWEHYATDIDHATSQKLAHANVLHAAKNRWRRLRRKLMKKAHTSESTLDESKRLDRLKLHTKESLRGFGELQWQQKDQHDRDKKNRHDTLKKEKKAKDRVDKRRAIENANARALNIESSMLKSDRPRSDKRVRVVSHRTTERLEEAALKALKLRRSEEPREELAGSEDDDDDDDQAGFVVNDEDDDDNDDNDNDDKQTSSSSHLKGKNGGNSNVDNAAAATTTTATATTTNNNNNSSTNNADNNTIDDDDDYDNNFVDDGPSIVIARNKSAMGYENLKHSTTWSQDNDTNATATPLTGQRRETVVNVNEADLATLDASLDVRMPTGQLVRMMTPRSTRKRSLAKPSG